MLDQAIKVLSGLQFMTDEAKAFEKDENSKRANIPAVFSIGELKAENAPDMLTVNCKKYFEGLLDTIKNWTAKAVVKIMAHN
jgi:hypothetical protein